MNTTKRIAEINSRQAEIRQLLESNDPADLDALDKELRDLANERNELERRQSIASGIASGKLEANEIVNPVNTRSEQPDPEEEPAEYRTAWLKHQQGKPLTASEQRAYAIMEQRAAYSTAGGSAGPAIPQVTANEIIKKIYEVAPILEKCRIFHVPGNFKIALEGTNTAAALHTELASITADSDTLGSVSLTGYEITKLVRASRATLAMTIPAFEQFIIEIIGENIARKIENYIFVGTGSSQPGGVAQGGKGSGGAYTAGTDQVTVAAASTVADADVESLYGMLGSGYERNAVWTMSKVTFFAYFYPLMNKSKNNLIEFANGKYYIMGCEVYFTGSLSKGVAYLGDFSYIIGNFSQEITVFKSEHSGLAANSIDYLGACVFDSKAVPAYGAFVKFVKSQS